MDNNADAKKEWQGEQFATFCRTLLTGTTWNLAVQDEICEYADNEKYIGSKFIISTPGIEAKDGVVLSFSKPFFLVTHDSKPPTKLSPHSLFQTLEIECQSQTLVGKTFSLRQGALTVRSFTPGHYRVKLSNGHEEDMSHCDLLHSLHLTPQPAPKLGVGKGLLAGGEEEERWLVWAEVTIPVHLSGEGEGGAVTKTAMW